MAAVLGVWPACSVRRPKVPQEAGSINGRAAYSFLQPVGNETGADVLSINPTILSEDNERKL